MYEQEYEEKLEALLLKPYWVIDFLPRRVPNTADGQYYEVERFFMDRSRLFALYRKFARVLIKLYCYYDFVFNTADRWEFDPDPAEVLELTLDCSRGGYMNFLYLKENTLITLNSGDLYMTVYNPSEALLETLKHLIHTEGLFIRDGAEP